MAFSRTGYSEATGTGPVSYADRSMVSGSRCQCPQKQTGLQKGTLRCSGRQAGRPLKGTAEYRVGLLSEAVSSVADG